MMYCVKICDRLRGKLTSIRESRGSVEAERRRLCLRQGYGATGYAGVGARTRPGFAWRTIISPTRSFSVAL